MRSSSLLLAVALTGLAAPAHAQTVRITLGPDAAAIARELMIDTAALEGLVRDQVRGLFGLADTAGFLRLASNAQSLANKGLAVDYTSTFDRFVVGAGLDVAVAVGDSDLQTLRTAASGELERAVPVAAGVQLSLMAGMKLSDRWFAYVSGLAYPLSVDGFDGSGYNAGAHLQFRFGQPVGSKVLLQWGGLVATAGFELSQAKYTLVETLDAPAPLSADVVMDTSSIGRLELVTRAMTVPVELTTSLRILYVLSIYGGVGADLQLGSGTTALGLDSTLTARISGGEELQLGTARVEFTGEGKPDRLSLRVLGGASANIGPLHVFTQLNVLTQDLTMGLAVGLRLGF
ncbi:hypothetical protein L6R52_34755 [Myxococcota bacterium]|nr:hypothetical protein [Myxococcota bacterium]